MACPEALSFDLAAALEEAGHPADAFGVFCEAAARKPGSEQAETALARAGEIAYASLHDLAKAAECYQRLLREYPGGEWEALCHERLRELGPQP